MSQVFGGAGASSTVASSAITGTTTNDDAAAGRLGEVMYTSRGQADGTALSSGSAINVGSPTSITLTPGDWDLTASVTATNAVLNELICAVTTASATIPGDASMGTWVSNKIFNIVSYPNSSIGPVSCAIPTFRVTVAAAATLQLYLVLRANFSGGAPAGFGFLMARRAR